MPVALIPRLLVSAVFGLMMTLPSPFVHAQTVVPRTVAVVMAPASFWTKRPAVTHAPGRDRTASTVGINGGKAHGSSTSGSAVENASGTKINDSIASELAGSKSVPWSIVVGLTLLTLLPALLLSMTPLVRLLVVFHFLRQALGTQTAPSNQVLMGLALMMTWFLMQPVLLEVEQTAVAPYSAGTITGEQAMDLGVAPVKRYMLRYAREKDLAVFASAGMTVRPRAEGRPADPGGGASLHPERVEGWIPDWRCVVSAVPAGGSGSGECDDLDRHDAAAACGDLDAIEDSFVCDGRWMESAGGPVD